MSELNPAQREAVTHVSGPLLVLAGAGSGKTRVITEKLAWLLDRGLAAPEHICAVTFTNRAAREMTDRIRARLGREVARALRVCTFHRLGLDIFRAECAAAGYRPRFSILDQADAQQLLREAVTAEGASNAAMAALQSRISTWKNDLVSPDAAATSAQDELEHREAAVYAHYQRTLRAYNAVDFDDLLVLPFTLLRDDPVALTSWRRRIRYLLVDEYQDTNRAQYELMKLLAGEPGRFTVVGDDDQSIYAWRGARSENLTGLARDWASLKVVKLEQNYRCSQRILNVANRLISGNPHVYEKRLWSAAGHGDAVRVMSAHSSADEAERIGAEILSGQRARGHHWRDYAILYRGNHQARAFEQVLRDRGIPYIISGGTSFFDRAEIKDLMAYLRLAVNADDDAAFLRIVNVPRRELGTQTLERLSRYAGDRGVSLLSATWEAGAAAAVGPRAAPHLQGFGRVMAQLASAVEDADAEPVALCREFLDGIDYPQWLRDSRDDPRAAERAQANVEEFLDWLGRLAQRLEGASLAEVLNHLALMDRLSRDDDDTSRDAVRLMTLHAAKGLEFDHVYLVGLEEDLLPHHACQEGAALEEERRLAYVGITRARRTLSLSHARTRSRFGEVQVMTPSRFLEEIRGEGVVFEHEDQPASHEEKRARAKDHLAGLRSLLGES